MVFNVGTVFAIYEAMAINKPLIERVVTVTGSPVKRPANLLVRMGTPISHILNYLGYDEENTGKILDGGPMMGKVLTDLEVPVTKGTSGILLLDKSEVHRREEGKCIRCAKCVEACALGLSPYLLGAYAKRFRFDEMSDHHNMDCCECGACAYVCPSNIPLLDYIRLGKVHIKRLEQERKNKESVG